MAEGLVFTSIAYPGKVNCPEGQAIFFDFEGQSYAIALSERVNVVNIQDFNNEFMEDEHGKKSLKYSIGQINKEHYNFNFEQFDADQVVDRKPLSLIYPERIFSHEEFSSFTIIKEYQDEKDLENAFDDSRRIFDEFLMVYRDVTGEGDIRLLKDINDRDIVSKQGKRAYNDDEKLRTFYENESVILEDIHMNQEVLTIRSFSKSKELTEEDKLNVFGTINKRMINNDFVNEFNSFLSKAREEITLRNNFKYAYLESFIAVEMFLNRQMWKYKNEILKVSNRKLKEHETNSSIKYILDIDIFNAIRESDFTDREKKVLNDIKGISKKRNKLVYNGEDVTRKEAEDAIKMCREFIDSMALKFEKLFSDQNNEE